MGFFSDTKPNLIESFVEKDLRWDRGLCRKPPDQGSGWRERCGILRWQGRLDRVQVSLELRRE